MTFGSGDIDRLTEQWGLIREDVSRALGDEASTAARFGEKYGSADWLATLELALEMSQPDEQDGEGE